MQAAKLIAARTPQWRQLDQLCVQLESRSTAKKLEARRRAEFASLYRAACADLALADAYQLPEETGRYLNQLVGRAHNQLYRTRGENATNLRQMIFETIPRQIFRDPAVRLAAAIFWLPFLASMFLASNYTPTPGFAEKITGRQQLMQMEEMHGEPFDKRGGIGGGFMSGFYLRHNTTIGIRCFAWGLAFGVGGVFETLFNAVALGAVFGHMTTVSNNQYFFEFVTAHGPFELTAIVLSAGAGMKMGFALVATGGLRRRDSILESAKASLPILGVAITLFIGAAFIEGFLSPSTLPYEIKALVGMLSTLALLGYLVVLGFAQQEADEANRELAARPAAAPERTSPFDEPAPAGPTGSILNR